MRIRCFVATLLGLLAAAGAQSPASFSESTNSLAHDLALLSHASRLIVVTTPDWNAVDGVLARYHHGLHGWQRSGEPVPVVVGRNGLAWNPEIIGDRGDEFRGPVKREGDGRSPAGIFRLGDGFGFEDPAVLGVQNYLPLTASTECVDDLNSKHYAQIVNRSNIQDVDWKSAEKMRSVDAYRLGVVVGYNTARRIPGNGSCIFLHVWQGAGKGTAGCTAMPEKDILEILRWINSKAPNAVLVQLPQSEYERLKPSWDLP